MIVYTQIAYIQMINSVAIRSSDVKINLPNESSCIIYNICDFPRDIEVQIKNQHFGKLLRIKIEQ